MPQAMMTIDQLVATQLKKDGYYMVFNTHYNQLFAPEAGSEHNASLSPFPSRDTTDEQARDEFIAFIDREFPNVKRFDVMDLMPLHYETWSFLGSIALDISPDDAVYQALVDRYGAPESQGSPSAMFWMLPLANAQEIWAARCELIDED